MKNTYLVSDYHSGHENIINLCKRFEFKNITECEMAMRINHNAIVTDSDEVINLGDIGYRCTPQHVADFLASLNGKHTIILGNHDEPFRKAYRQGLFRDMLKKGKLEVIGGETVVNDLNMYISLGVTIEGCDVFLSHLAIRSWPGAFRGTIHAFGHSHSKLPMLYKSMDVGVDTFSAVHPRYTPYSWKEIKTIMDAITTPFSEQD